MKQIAIFFVGIFLATLLATGCEPESCRDFRDLICKHCGPKSQACKEVKKRRGRDEKKCKAGVNHVKTRVKTKQGKRTLCTLLNSDLKKKKK